MKYSINEIASILSLLPDSHIALPNAMVSELLTDSRSVSNAAQTLFFALRTHAGDGHDYIEDLYEKGVRNFVVDDNYLVAERCYDANYLVVEEPLAALQSLAAYHRRRFRELPVIAITGSTGKTTVKEWLYQLLCDDFHIVRSPRSYNSQIGVPLSLWEIDDNTSLAIIEAGISTTGEMQRLQAMIRPTIGVITNIGAAHDEGFASIEEKAREKARILTSCESVIYGSDNVPVQEAVAPIVASGAAETISWSFNDEQASIFVTDIRRSDETTTITLNISRLLPQEQPLVVEIPFTGAQETENAVTCVAVALSLHVAPAKIAERMRELTPVGARIDVLGGINNCTLVVDGYTSDYNSLPGALDFLRRRCESRRNAVILSDLQPENFEEEELYAHVSDLLAERKVNRLYAIGPRFCAHRNCFGNIAETHFFTSTDEFLATVPLGDFDDEVILLKGAPEFEFERIANLLLARHHQTVEEVDLSALTANFKFFRSLLRRGVKTVGMVKASGYGVGSVEIAQTLLDAGCDYLAVAAQDEGVELRRAGINAPIIVLNPMATNYKTMFRHRLEPEVYSIEQCRAIVREGTTYGVSAFPIHVKIDSGMHRLGFTKEQLPELIDLLRGQQVAQAHSVFTHLCVADEPEQDAYTREQLQYFDTCAQMLREAFPQWHILRHALNTSGIVRFPHNQYDMVRIGIGLYGIRTVFDGSEDALRPVATLRAPIISIKEWDEGTTIGYGRRGVLLRHSRIATVSIGYADGIDRHCGNGAISVWVDSTLCPTVGNICMDAMMIDITDAHCGVGDMVEIFGNNTPIEQLSDACGTIPYEILTSVSPRVRRIYFKG